jgi:signal transduction histidine kinase
MATELNLTEQRLRQAAEASGIRFWDWDISSPPFVTGGGRSGEPGRLVDDFNETLQHVLKEDQHLILEALQLALTKGTNYQCQFRVLGADGSIHWLSATGIVSYDAGGKPPTRVVGTHTDITQQKQKEVELREALRIRDHFLSIASHELRTPITILKSQVQMLLRQMKKTVHESSGERTCRTLENADKQVAKLAYLVDELLDVTRIINGRLKVRPEELDLSSLVTEAVEHLSTQFEDAACRVTLEIEPNVRGLWDRRGLEQVVTNLLTNAIKYAPGTEVRVCVNKPHEEQVRLIIRDQGMGIPREDQNKLFNRFARASDSGPVSGLGLGLYIVKQLVTLHEGTVGIESEPGQGATFTVELPLRPRLQQS